MNQLAVLDWDSCQRAVQRILPDKVSDRERFYLSRAFSRKTLQSYRSSLLHFIRWIGIEDPLPVSQAIIRQYIAAHGDQFAPSTLHHRLAALSFIHRFRGYEDDPTKNVSVESIMKGVRNVRAEQGWRKRQARPFTQDEIKIILNTWGDAPAYLRDKAFFLVGLFGAFRTDELCQLKMESIKEKHALIWTIQLNITKQDQSNQHVKVKKLPKLSGSLACPVTALQAWLDVAGITEGFIFPGQPRKSHNESIYISHPTANRIVRHAARLIYDDPARLSQYSGYSLRSSFITLARAMGIPDTQIAQQTLHEDLSTLDIYDRPISKHDRDIAAYKILESLNN